LMFRINISIGARIFLTSFWEDLLGHEHGHFEHLLHSVAVVNGATILSIVWFSFVMSWHCAAMCGPLVCGGFSKAESSRREVWIGVFLYNLGRVISYALVGAAIGTMVGSLSESLTEFLPSAGIALSLMFATILGAQGFLLLLNREFVFAPKALSLLATNLSRRGHRLLSARARNFVLGLATVFLPCMTLSSALAAGAMTGDGAVSALIMVGFVVGTLPVMILLPIISQNFASHVATKIPLAWLRRGAGGFLLLASGITILRIFH
jgi:uncharacterized protein